MDLDYRQAATLLRDQDNVLVLTHLRPDGDTLGCAIALCETLRQCGKTAWMLNNPETTPVFLPYLDGYIAPTGFAPHFIVTVDIADTGLLPENALPYHARGIDLVIDHHMSCARFGAYNCVDDTCAACGELIYRIALELGALTPAIALPLYVAVSTDTGCFVYGNTTSNTLRTAAALIDTGIPYREANKRHFRTKSMKRLQIEAAILSSVHFYDQGSIAFGRVSLDMMAHFDATESDVEDIAGLLGQIEGVVASVTMRELDGGKCKLSLRTISGTVNACAACAVLGGGGHAAAAGCTLDVSLDEAETAILAAIRQVR